jgi:hypothetical protein
MFDARCHRLCRCLVAVATLLAVAAPRAQEGPSARTIAPVDLTGYWVSVVTEDWAWRMRTPPRGDYASVPLNEEGIRIAEQWNESLDGSCLAFGAATMLRVPTRIHIQWEDDNTLLIESDNGRQTRRLHFDHSVAPAAPSLQGHSLAAWQLTSSVTGSGATGGVLTSAVETQPWATLEVVTTDLTAAWLRPNGVPISEDARIVEYFDRFDVSDEAWFTVSTLVEDPKYLTEPFLVSSNFRKEHDGAAWNPKSCLK